MALFARKKKTDEKSVATTDKKVVVKESKSSLKAVPQNFDVTKIIKHPRVSEKAAVVAESSNAYTFDVYPDATKKQIQLAIEKIYKVVPVKIAIAQVKPKKVRIRGTARKDGVKSGGKKAFVYLKKGEKIEFI